MRVVFIDNQLVEIGNLSAEQTFYLWLKLTQKNKKMDVVVIFFTGSNVLFMWRLYISKLA